MISERSCHLHQPSNQSMVTDGPRFARPAAHRQDVGCRPALSAKVATRGSKPALLARGAAFTEPSDVPIATKPYDGSGRRTVVKRWRATSSDTPSAGER